MTDEQQIAALRDAIRRAGATTRAIRWWIGGLLLIAAAVFGTTGFAAAVLVDRPSPPNSSPALIPYWVTVPVAWMLAGAAAIVVLALPAAFLLRAALRVFIARRLAVVPGKAREGVLLPLMGTESGDTRKIAAALLRRFRMSNELAPATAPGARGDEASPGEDARSPVSGRSAALPEEIPRAGMLVGRSDLMSRGDRRRLSRALGDAILAGDARRARDLLARGADLDPRDTEHGETALLLAAQVGSNEIARLLLDRGASVGAADRCYGRTALAFALWGREPQMIDFLVKRGADVDARDRDNRTPLKA